MAFSSTPTPGKWGNIYWLRPNGFKGSGVNDVTWGASSSESDSAHFEVVIDGVGTGTASCDTFKWREDGGSWTTTVDITGASQDIVGANMTIAIAFADDGTGTPHTLDDQWSHGTLFAEPTTVSTVYAQITDTGKRLLNPNAPPVWTDDGSLPALIVDNTIGKATFGDNAGTVTVAGDNGYILESGLQQLGYLKGWNLNATVDLADASRLGQQWKEFEPGQAGATGSIEKMLIVNHTLFDAFEDCAGGTQNYFLLQLFTYDPDQDQTGSHINMWVVFNSLGITAPNTDLVKNNIGFTVHGIMSTITANV